jgi:N utilization substance protein A
MKVAANFFKELELYAHEKNLHQKELLRIVESAIANGLSSYYSTGRMKVVISKLDNSINAFEVFDVVKDVKDAETEIAVDEVKSNYPDAKIGQVLEVPCHFPNMERVVVRKVRDIFSRNLNLIERDMQYEAFKDKVGNVSSYLIKGIEFGNVILDTGIGDGLIRKEDLIPGESFRIHDRVRAIVSQVLKREKGFQVLLSRSSNEFLMYLLKDVVPEIADGSIEIKSVARIPGKRAKIAVSGIDPRIDPVGVCVGIKGARINSIVKELNGEKIDVVLWSQDDATFILNAIAPAEVSKIVIDGYNVTIVVPDSQLSLAIGAGGFNIKLASKLTKRGIKVVSEAEYSQIQNDETNAIVAKFEEVLAVDDMMARFLVAQGFSNFNDILNVSMEDLASIDGFDNEIAEELQSRATNYIEKQFKDAELSEELIKFIDNKDLLLILCEKSSGIKTINDLADLSVDELMDIVSPSEFTQEIASDMIIQARKELGWLNE